MTIDLPTKPIAPIPMLLPSSFSSSSKSAIFGSGFLSPTTRKQAARFPKTIQVSFEPPSPIPIIAGWQAKPRFPNATIESKKNLFIP